MEKRWYAYDDVDGAAAVVLDNFVACLIGTAANDPGLVARSIILDGYSILAY